MSSGRAKALAWLLLAAGGCFGVVAEAPTQLGPLNHESPTVRLPGTRFQAVGPLFSGESTTEGTWWALPPLVTDFRDDTLERTHVDLLYPLVTYDRFGTEYRWQLLQWLSFAGGEGVAGEAKTRRNLFPFFFSQKSTNPTNDYFALLPIYGHLQNRFFRDESRFILFPLYVETKKRGVRTRNFPLPFVHVRDGGGVSGWQLWPALGHESKSPSWRSNAVEELELVPGHDKWFLAWPFCFRETMGLGSTNAVTNTSVLPLFSLQRSPGRDNTTFLWPFFSVTDDRAQRFKEWGMPWPFLGWADGPGRTARRVWPLGGFSRSSTQQRDFVLWPGYTHRRINTDKLESERWRVLWFLYDQSEDRSKTTDVKRQRRDLWPLFTWRQDFEGRTRLQVLAPLEPHLKNNQSIERSYSPLWTLYLSEHNPARGMTSQSLLWNFWSRQVTTNSTQTSSFFGIVRTRRDETGRHWRFFWRAFAEAQSDSATAVSDTAGPARRLASGLLALPPRRGDFLARPAGDAPSEALLASRERSPGVQVSSP